MFQIKLRPDDTPWTLLDYPGVAMRLLVNNPDTGASTVLTRLDPGAVIPAHWHSFADETVTVLEGDFVEDGAVYGVGSFFAGQAGTPHGPHSTLGGCVLLTTFSAAVDFVLE